MPFSSSVISTVNIGTWDYFIMSDNTAVWRAMNGLAAWFSGSSGIIQGAALLGSLITLSMILFGAATHSKSSVGTGTLGGWFFFMSMMGVTGQAQVTNIYTNQVTIINNVPALALVPASMFSKAAYKIFTSMETSFQSVTGSYMSVDQNAFVGPLDILLSLRSSNFPSTAPALNKSLVQVVHDCADNPVGGAAPPIEDAKDALIWLQTWGRLSGMTKIYPPTDTTGQGTLMDCTSALSYINTQFDAYAGGNAALMAFVNSETTKKNPQDPNGAWNGGSVQSSFDFLFGAVPGMQQSALEFTKNALTATAISYTKDCLTQSGMLTTAENCMAGSIAAADGKERWKTDAAMSGSGFLKTMFTSMGFLQVLFFALFPFIAIYGLVVVNKTVSVFGGYILIGIWSQSWMIVVAPIQSYIQTAVIDDMTKALSLSHAVTLGNINTVYDQLSTKLAVASDMMANAQMLSLALLSGSVVAMSSLAGKWSGGGHNDSSMLQNKAADPAALFKGSSLATVSSVRNDHGGVTQSMDTVGASDISLSSSYNATTGQTSSKSRQKMTSEQRADALVASVAQNTGFTLSKSDAMSIESDSKVATQFTGSMSAGVAGSIVKNLLGAKAGALSGKEFAAKSALAQKAEGQAVSALAAKDSSFLSKLSSTNPEERGAAWGDVAGYAADILTAGALAAEFLSVGGSVAAPATIVAAQAAKGGIKSFVSGAVTKMTKAADKAKTIDESRAMGVLRGAAGAVGAVAEGVAGNVNAVAQETMQEGIKKSSSYKASKENKVGTTVSANENDSLTKAVTGSMTDSFNDTAGKSEVQSTAVNLSHSSMALIGASGINGKSSEQTRIDAASTAAILRTGGLKKKDGSAYTADEISAADNFVSKAMLGHSSSDAGLDQFKKNVLFENSLTGAVDGSFGSGHSMPAGANFNAPIPTSTTGSKPAVAATKGHWEKSNAKDGQPPKTQDWTLQNWKNGDDPANTQGVQAAAKAGYKWSAGTAGSAAVEGGTRIAEPALSNQSMGTHVNQSGVGANMANAKGSNAYQAMSARIISSANASLEQMGHKAVTSKVALQQFSPEQFTAFDKASDQGKELIIAAAAAKVVGDTVGAIAKKVATPGTSAVPGAPANATPEAPHGSSPGRGAPAPATDAPQRRKVMSREDRRRGL